MTRALLAVFLAASALAQDTGIIEGSVVDSITSAPISKARVMLMPQMLRPPAGGGPMMPPKQASAMSDASGAFSIGGLAPGTYGVTTFHPRYPVAPGPPAMQQITVAAGERARVTVPLRPGATISGRVLDEDGDGVPGCVVRAQHAGGMPSGMGGMSSMRPTDPDGEYRLWGIVAGKYTMNAVCGRPPFQPRPFSAGPPTPPTLGYLQTWYPDATDASAATALDLQPGAERTGLDIRVKATRVTTVTGVVTAPAGLSVENVRIQLIPKKSSGPFDQRRGGGTRQDGTFQVFGVPPGSYDLVASVFGPNMREAGVGARQPVEVTDRTPPVQVALQRAIEVPGTLVVEGDGPTQQNLIAVQLLPEDGMGVLPPSPPAQVSDSGSFVLKNVLPGRWRVNVQGPRIFARSADFAGRTLEDMVLEIGPGAAGPLSIRASTRVPKIEGNCAPGQNYTFFDRRDASQSGLMLHSIQCGPDGRLSPSFLPPGQYRVVAGAPFAPDSASQDVTITEGQSVTLDLKGGR